MKVSLVIVRLAGSDGREYILRGFKNAEHAREYHHRLAEHLKKRPTRPLVENVSSRVRKARQLEYRNDFDEWNRGGPTPGQYITASSCRIEDVTIEEQLP